MPAKVAAQADYAGSSTTGVLQDGKHQHVESRLFARAPTDALGKLIGDLGSETIRAGAPARGTNVGDVTPVGERLGSRVMREPTPPGSPRQPILDGGDLHAVGHQEILEVTPERHKTASRQHDDARTRRSDAWNALREAKESHPDNGALLHMKEREARQAEEDYKSEFNVWYDVVGAHFGARVAFPGRGFGEVYDIPRREKRLRSCDVDLEGYVDSIRKLEAFVRQQGGRPTHPSRPHPWIHPVRTSGTQGSASSSTPHGA